MRNQTSGVFLTRLSFTFFSTAAGDYQCIFADHNLDEVLIVPPMRLDSGKITNFLSHHV